MALAELQLSQPGAGITLANDTSGTLSSVDAGGGLAYPITITATMSGGVLPTECDFTLTIRDVPQHNDDDSDGFVSLTNTTRNTWTLTLKARAWGALVLELTVRRGTATETTVRRYDFKSLVLALPSPGNAEVIDGRAARSSYGGTISRKSWYSRSNSAPPDGYKSTHRALVRQIEANSTSKFNILRFGTPGAGNDITLLLQRAVAAAATDPGGSVYVPRGRWTCAAEILVSAAASSGPSTSKAVWIEGDHEYASFIIGYIPNGSLFRFSAQNVPAGYTIGGGLRNLFVWSGNESVGVERGTGVTFEGTFFAGTEHTWIRGFTTGLKHGLLTGDMTHHGSHFQVCDIGANLTGENSSIFYDCKFNQNSIAQIKYAGGPASIIGGLIQGTPSVAGLWSAPTTAGSVWLNVCDIYVEHSGTMPAFRLDAPTGAPTQGAGTIKLNDINFNVGAAGGPPPYVVVANRHRIYASKWTGGAGQINATNCQIMGDGLAGAMLLDVPTKSSSTFRLDGCYGLGLPPTTPGAPIQNKRFDISADLNAYLADWWDARLGTALDVSGRLSTWTGQKKGVVLTASATKPQLVRDAFLKNEPAIRFAQSDSTYLDSGTLTGGQIPATGSGDAWMLAVLTHPVQSLGSENGPVLRVQSTDNDAIQLEIKGNTTSADTIVARVQDHVTGGATTSGVSVYHVGHIVECELGADPEYGFPGPNRPNLLWVDGGTGTGGNPGNFNGTLFEQFSRFVVGSDAPLGGSSYSDVNLALVIVCHTIPPRALREALRAWLADRFDLVVT